MENILTVNNVTKRYGNVTALSGVSFDLPEGRILGLLGPNGSGKTTFMKMAAGLLTVDEGEIKVCGKNIGPGTKSLVAFLPDKNFLCEWMTVEKMLEYTADFFTDFCMERAENMLKNLGIDKKRKIKTLSKGTQEKIALIITMSRDAKLYLLDEPIGGVDPAARDYVIRTILNNFSPSSSVIISTHLISDIQFALSEFMFINNGMISMRGTTDKLKAEKGCTIDEYFREVFRC